MAPGQIQILATTMPDIPNGIWSIRITDNHYGVKHMNKKIDDGINISIMMNVDQVRYLKTIAFAQSNVTTPTSTSVHYADLIRAAVAQIYPVAKHT
jgi:hypothetical protein